MTKRNILLRKCMTIMLSLALVFTMMPMVPGAVEKAHAETRGSAITITDSTGTKVIDTTEGGDTAYHTGAGYAYDPETNTLTLEGFNGKQILSNGDFNLHLKGTNTLTLEDAMATGSTIYGLKATATDGSRTYGVTVTADEGGTLNITGKSLTEGVYAWYADTYFTNGTLKIDVSSTTSNTVYGVYGGVVFTENETDPAVLDIKVENQGSNVATGQVNGGVDIENRGNVTINIEAKADNEAKGLSGGLYVIDASPVITVKATKLDGSIGPQQRAVFNPIYYMQLTEGGIVTLEGTIVPQYGQITWNANTIVTTPADNAYYWETDAEFGEDIGRYKYAVMKNLDGTPVTKAVFEYSAETTRTLQYNGAGKASVPEGKVGTPIKSLELQKYIAGEIDSRYSTVAYKIEEGSLPEGLTLNTSSGTISGTPTAKTEAGTIEVTATDDRDTPDTTDDQTITFTVPYGEIVEADRFITVGETDVEIKSDASGAGWEYDADTKTLTLNEYTGGNILSEVDFNLHLKGENTITMTDEMAIDGRIYGLKAEASNGAYCYVTVTADESGILNITGENLSTSTFVWYANTNFANGTLKIDASITSGILYGIYGGMTFTEDETNSATLNVNVVNKGDNAAIGLGNGGVDIENRGNVTIKSDAKADSQATALSTLQIINASPVITAKATKLDGSIGAMQRAVSEPIYNMQLTEGGKVTLEGMIVIYEGRISWNENTIVTTPANSAYYWAPAKAIDKNATNDYVYMKNLDETPVTKAIFEYSEDPTRTLQYNGEGIASIPAGKVGTAIAAVYLHRYISGELDSRGSGDSYMVYKITEGSLPEGLILGKNNGRISGTPTAKAEAGTIEVTATDSRGTYYDTTDDQTITFTVPYGAIASAKPVTAITLSEEEFIINKEETVEFTATVTPTDASYAEVSVTRENFNIIGIDSIGDPVDGVTAISITANTYVGKDVLTVTSKDTGVKKTINVYVKESKPTASQDETHITGLLPNTEYTINSEEYVSDGSGKIAIDPSWRKTTVSIVRTNDEPKCNSDAQELEIAAQPLDEDWVSLEYSSIAYNEEAREPAVTVNDGIKDLVEDTDYTVEYADNVNIGTATVTVTGINDYSGTVKKTFNIHGINIKNAEVTLSQDEFDYNGEEHKPGATVVLDGDTLLEDTDYTVAYSKNINAGTGFVTVTGKGIYEGGISVVFKIHAVSLEDESVTLDYDTTTYDGTAKEPGVTVGELTADDYTVSYSNNTNVGTATVTIEGKGNYKGTITKDFTIEKADVTDVEITLDKDSFTYTGFAQGPVITVKDGEKTLEEGTDYILSGDTQGTIAGKYTITVTGEGNYDGIVEKSYIIKLAEPKNTKLTTVTSTGYPKLTWDGVAGATKYEVWRKVGSTGTYKKQYTTTGTSYTNSSATPGTVYYYKVKAIHSNEDCNSAFSAAKSIACDLAQPKNVKLTTVTSTGYPKLTWDKVEGADKYEVWRKVGSSGTYKRQYTTTGTSYTNSSATPGTVYYYKVKAICEKNSGGNSAFSGEKSIACDLAQPKNLKVTTVASSGKPKVTWSKVEGATKYEVWRKVGSSGTYAKFYTTTGTSMTNTSATAGKAYYYKVKAICGKNSGGNSAFSASDFVICDLAAPKITVSGTKKPGKIVVSWSKVTGADRYYIYRSTSKDGTYSKYSSTTSTTWTNTSVTKGKTYYYKAKAIYDGKSAANSAYSNMDYARVR